jgi:type VI secretion system protein ImpG
MEPKLTENYRRELAFLGEAFKEFARDHPREAGRLGLPSRTADPHVARLCEGFALLTARIRTKIEDELPEVTDALLGVLYPHYTRPWPSAGVVRVDVPTDQAAVLRTGPVVAAGSPLRSRPAGVDLPCRFRTAYELRIWPLALGPARLVTPLTPEEAADGARAAIALPLRATGGTRFGQLAPSFSALRFFLAGEGRAPFALRERLLDDLVRVEVRPPAGSPYRPIALRQGRSRRVTPVGFGPDEGLVPFPTRSFIGYRNLQEYFAFPEKFLFVDLHDLGPLLAWDQADQAELRFYLRTPPDAELRLVAESFQLNSTPIVNLYEHDCQPIRRDETRYEYAVEPDVRHAREIEVYSIERVAAGAEVYLPFQHHRGGVRASIPSTYWVARRRPSLAEGNKRTEVTLAFCDAVADPIAPPSRVVSVRALCTDLDRPTRLPGGDIEAEWSTAPAGPIRRLTPMTPAWPPPVGRDAQWRLLAHLALNHLPLGDPPGQAGASSGADVLRTLLRLHVPADSPAGDDLIEGIARVEARPDHAYLPGRGVVGGVRTTIDLNPSRFERGPLLLAEVLEHFLGHYVSMNAFSRLVLELDGREARRWPPRAGDRILL